MKKLCKSSLIGTLMLTILAVSSPLLKAAPTEEALIQTLKSRSYEKVLEALAQLPLKFPKSTKALPAIREILRSRDVVVAPEIPPNILRVKAIRSLGLFQATLEPEDFIAVSELLKARDANTVMDVLKGLRGMKAPEAVVEILPLLKDENSHVVRDSCRTLAVLGNKDTIPFIEPLLKHSKSDVRKDARDAIAALRIKT